MATQEELKNKKKAVSTIDPNAEPIQTTSGLANVTTDRTLATRPSSGISTGAAATSLPSPTLRTTPERTGNVAGSSVFMQGINSQAQLERRLSENVAGQTRLTPGQVTRPGEQPGVAPGVAPGAAPGVAPGETGVPAEDTVFGETKKEPTTIDEALGQTYAQKAESQFKGEFNQLYENAKKYGIDLPFKSFDEYLTWKKTASQADMDYLKKQQDIARELEASQAQKSASDIKAASAATTAALAQSREGVISSTKPQIVSQFQQEMDRQARQIELERQSAENQRQEAMRQLKQAQEEGDIGLVESIQGRISQIEDNIRKIDTEALNAATLANEQALNAMSVQGAETRANLNAFTSLVDQGVELGTDGIIQFSQSLGIPFEAAYSYYEGAKNIREDKNLSLEQKRIANAQNAQDLQDQIDRVNTTAATNTEYLKKLYTSGADADTIAAFKSAAGITDQSDPIYQANLRSMQLENMISQAKLNGQPIGFQEWSAWLSSAATSGGANTVLPSSGTKYTNGKYEVIPMGDGIRVNASEGSWGDQCGAFVNDFFGKGIMVDEYAKKKAMINSDVPVVGSAFVMGVAGKAAPYGHTGIVESIDYDKGVVNVIDSNWGSNEKIQRHSISISSIDGYYVPPNGKVTTGTGGSMYSDTQKKVLDSLSGINPKDIDSTTLKVLEDAGLSSTDLLSYTPQYKQLPNDKQDQIQTILDGIEALKTADGKNAAVGFGIQKYIPGWLKPGEGEFTPGSDAAAFAAKFNSFRDNLALPALDSLKGAMSDKDIQFLRNSATALSLDMSQEEFDKELQRLEDKYKEILNKGTDTSSSMPGVSIEDQYVQSINLDDMILDQYLQSLK